MWITALSLTWIILEFWGKTYWLPTLCGSATRRYSPIFWFLLYELARACGVTLLQTCNIFEKNSNPRLLRHSHSILKASCVSTFSFHSSFKNQGSWVCVWMLPRLDQWQRALISRHLLHCCLSLYTRPSSIYQDSVREVRLSQMESSLGHLDYLRISPFALEPKIGSLRIWSS